MSPSKLNVGCKKHRQASTSRYINLWITYKSILNRLTCDTPHGLRSARNRLSSHDRLYMSSFQGNIQDLRSSNTLDHRIGTPREDNVIHSCKYKYECINFIN